VASGGADGAVLLHTLRAGRHLRTILPSHANASGGSIVGAAGGSYHGRGGSIGGGAEVGGGSGGGGGASSSMQRARVGGTPSWVCLVEAITARVLVYCGGAAVQAGSCYP
jgi:hypothetical protein